MQAVGMTRDTLGLCMVSGRDLHLGRSLCLGECRVCRITQSVSQRLLMLQLCQRSQPQTRDSKHTTDCEWRDDGARQARCAKVCASEAAQYTLVVQLSSHGQGNRHSEHSLSRRELGTWSPVLADGLQQRPEERLLAGGGHGSQAPPHLVPPGRARRR